MFGVRFPQLAKACAYLLRTEKTSAVSDAREFSSDGREWRELDSELVAEVENRVLSLVKYHRSNVCVLPVSERVPQRQYTSANPRPRLEDRNLVTGGLQSMCSYET